MNVLFPAQQPRAQGAYHQGFDR